MIFPHKIGISAAIVLFKLLAPGIGGRSTPQASSPRWAGRVLWGQFIGNLHGLWKNHGTYMVSWCFL